MPVKLTCTSLGHERKRKDPEKLLQTWGECAHPTQSGPGQELIFVLTNVTMKHYLRTFCLQFAGCVKVPWLPAENPFFRLYGKRFPSHTRQQTHKGVISSCVHIKECSSSALVGESVALRHALVQPKHLTRLIQLSRKPKASVWKCEKI